MLKILCLLIILCGGEVIGLIASMSQLSGASDLMSKAKEALASEDGIKLKNITIHVDEHMNNGAAVKLYVVIAYNRELAMTLSKLTADRFLKMKDQLCRDYPDEIVLMGKEIVAKEQVFPWKDVKYPGDHMTPLCAWVFVSYSSNRNRTGNRGGLTDEDRESMAGESAHPYRAKIPNAAEDVDIFLEKENFKIKEKKDGEEEEKK